MNPHPHGYWLVLLPLSHIRNAYAAKFEVKALFEFVPISVPRSLSAMPSPPAKQVSLRPIWNRNHPLPPMPLFQVETHLSLDLPFFQSRSRLQLPSADLQGPVWLYRSVAFSDTIPDTQGSAAYRRALTHLLCSSQVGPPPVLSSGLYR